MAINPYVPATAVGNGVQVDFAFTFPYIFPAHVKATITGTPTSGFTFLSSNVLRFNTPPANGATIRIFRETPGDALAAEIQPGGPLPIEGLNRNFLQSLYYSQETQYDAANQSTAGLQAQVTAATNTANNASANAGAAITTANAAEATANGLAASIATANSTASSAQTTANTAVTTANAAVTTANNAVAIASNAAAPTAAIAFVARNTAPTGWLKANGAAVSRTTYSDLFGVIGVTFGAGDGSTTFNLPDLRGEFVRAWDDARGIDSGRVFGSAQGSANLSHNHGINDPGHGHSINDPGHNHGYSRQDWGAGALAGGSYTVGAPQSSQTGVSGTGISVNANGTGITTQANGGTESRPRNIALLAVIKF